MPWPNVSMHCVFVDTALSDVDSIDITFNPRRPFNELPDQQ